jgi:hypothetical protein
VTIVLIILAVLLVVAAVVGIELMRLFSGTRQPADLPELKKQYAGQDFYRPIERLFSEDDERFLANRGMLTPERRKELQHSRRKVMKLYLRQFRSDFHEAWGVCRLLAPFSEDPDFGVNLIRQLVTFYRLYSTAQIHLTLHAYQPGDLAVNELVESLRRVRRVAFETLSSVENLAMEPTAA